MGEIRASVTLENRDDRGAVYNGRWRRAIRKGQSWPSAKPNPPTKGPKPASRIYSPTSRK